MILYIYWVDNNNNNNNNNKDILIKIFINKEQQQQTESKNYYRMRISVSFFPKYEEIILSIPMIGKKM